jgi:hypothetical protein
MAGPRVKLPSNHSLRNPLRPIQPTRRRREGDSAATKASKKLKRAQNKRARLALESDCDDFAELRDQEIVRLAALHHVKEDRVRKLLTNASTVKRERAMTLRNAIVHDLSLKAKAGKYLSSRSSCERELTLMQTRLRPGPSSWWTFKNACATAWSQASCASTATSSPRPRSSASSTSSQSTARAGSGEFTQPTKLQRWTASRSQMRLARW